MCSKRTNISRILVISPIVRAHTDALNDKLVPDYLLLFFIRYAIYFTYCLMFIFLFIILFSLYSMNAYS